jgi:hypothetical protein
VALAGFAACLAPVFAGCSEPPPLIPKGAWSVVFEDIPGCAPGAENQAIGVVDADSTNELKDDGVDGIQVSCTVIDKGGGFEILAAESGKSLSLTLAVDSLSPNATQQNPSKGTVYYSTPNTGKPFTSTECDFYFLPDTPQGVRAGQVFFTFKCDQIAAGIDNVCRVPIAYAAFENCKSGADGE